MTSSNDPADRTDRPRRAGELVGAILVAGMGVAWGLGLARLLAEAAFWSLPYTSPVAAGVVSIGGAVLALVVWHTSSRGSGLPGPHWTSLVPLVLPLAYVLGVASGPLAGGALLVGGAGLAALMVWRDRPCWFLPALLGVTALSVYLRTLLPSVGEADTLEFQVVAAQLGLAHPTGYPLYILLAKAFTLLPLKNPAWRVNLASAVFGAAAVVVVYGILRRLTGSRQAERSARGEGEGGGAVRGRGADVGELVSFLTAMALAFSPTFWSQATAAEVYTLHNLLVAVALWLLLPERVSSAGLRPGPVRRWQGVFFLLGLSLTNHLTTALLLPAVAAALAWDRPPLRAKDWVAGAALFALGLSLYLFIPLRWPALHDGAWMTLREFVRYVTGGQFHGALRLGGWQDPTRWRIIGRLMLEPFGWAGLTLAAVGVLGWANRRRRALLVAGVTYGAFVLYGLDYYVADVAVFLLPAHLILAVWVGAGAALVTRWLSRASVGRSAAYLWRPILIALLALVPLSQLWSHLPRVDRSGERRGYLWGRYALQQPLAQGGAVLADTKKFAPLYYLQQVEGARPDLDIVLLGTEELYQAELRRRLAVGQVVYLARYLPGLGGLYLRSVGPLAEVRGQAPGETADPEGVLARLGDTIQLLNTEVEPDPLGRPLRHVTLKWLAETPVDGDFVVRLRLVDAQGKARWTSGGLRPVNGLFPTNAWPPDTPISDYYDVPIEPWLLPGRYTLQVGLFPPFGAEGLPWDGGSGPWVPLGDVQIQPAPEPMPLAHRRRITLGDGVWLTGSDVPQEGGAGAPLTVDLAWRNVEEDEQVWLAWHDGAGGWIDAGTYPLAGGMVRSRHTVSAPPETGSYRLHVGLLGGEARCGWLARPSRSCALGSVNVGASDEGLADFGDRVLLVSADVGRDAAAPGQEIPVSLRWRGLRTMETDYTVFVHLVGPDGRLHGQADSWPVQGSYPTSQWQPGREVVDGYEVRLESHAPPGRYQVEVGLYDLETMDRLRVLDEAGEPVADSFVVGAFTVSE